MNVQLLPAALEEIAVLRASGYRGSGFLLGAEIGRFQLVEHLLPLDFAARESGSATAAACENFGERLLGVFFCRRRPCASDWFVGDLVLAIGPRQLRLLTGVPGAAGQRARLLPLPESKEGQWPT